jgi:regulator of protease activity HflC (stomatin/prohibitin superfamily)
MVDLRVVALEVPPQEVITSDNVTVKVSAVIFFQVVDAQSAIIKVYNFAEATSQIAQTTLRAVLGQSSLDELLGMRDKVNAKLQAIIDHQIIATDGEFQAAQVLANSAEILSTQPAALALRYMQTLLDMGSNQNSTIVFPIPIELIRPLLAAPVPMSRAAPTNGAVPSNGAELAKAAMPAIT